MNWNPAYPVYRQAQRTPERLALSADGIDLSYADLSRRASVLAEALRDRGIAKGSRVGILGSRSLIAVEAVLAIAWVGAAYVPLGLRWPSERLDTVLGLVDLDAAVIDAGGLERLTPRLLATVRHLVVPSEDGIPEFAGSTHPVTLGLSSVHDRPGFTVPAEMAAGDVLYVIFTSGTTGVPKGVVVGAGSVVAYITALGRRKEMTEEDRASQFTELSFDPSLGEIFIPWWAGASLHVVPAVSRASPTKFIRERALTVWGSTPAAIAWLRDTRALQPGSLPSLRYSSFGGEPLPLSSVLAWQAAAPNSAIDNLYGPTEATVDCVGQRVEPGNRPVVTPGRDVLAIGTPHLGTELSVLGADLRPLSSGTVGELAIAGKQLAIGYLGRSEATAERFPEIDGKRWYLTGDLAMLDADGMFHHLGRADNQIKIQGHRVELEEVEAHLRELSGTDQVAVIAYPIKDGVAQSLVGFVAGQEIRPRRLRELLRSRLPAYMVPRVIHELDHLPRSAAGKFDRQALVRHFAQEAQGPDAASDR